jgi:hypothetical protein
MPEIPAPTPAAKPWWQSKTIVAALVGGALGLVAITTGKDLRDSQDEIVNAVEAAVLVVTTVVTIYGRVTAKHEITAK